MRCENCSSVPLGPSVGGRRRPAMPAKLMGEMFLMAEATFGRYLGDRHVGLGQELLCPPDTQLNEITMRRHADLGFEHPRYMARAALDRAGYVHQSDGIIEIFAHERHRPV